MSEHFAKDDAVHQFCTADTVAIFDTLLEELSDVETILVRAAQKTGLNIGLRSADGALNRLATPAGTVQESMGIPADAVIATTRSGVHCWTDASSAQCVPLTRLILERCAAACAISLAFVGAGLDDEDQARLVRMAVSPDTGTALRVRALARLNLRAEVLQVVLVAGDDSHVQLVRTQILEKMAARTCPGSLGLAATGSMCTIIVGPPIDFDIAAPPGSVVSLGSERRASELHLSAADATAALRFGAAKTTFRPGWIGDTAVMDFRQLGAFGLLAHRISAGDIDELEDVQTLERISRAHPALDILDTLEVVAATESLRKASAVLHLHHNSVAYRVSIAEQALGFHVSDPYARFRIMLCLILLRLRGPRLTADGPPNSRDAPGA